MGGAFIFPRRGLLAFDPEPGRLSAISSPQVSLHHNNWIADILQEGWCCWACPSGEGEGQKLPWGSR